MLGDMIRDTIGAMLEAMIGAVQGHSGRYDADRARRASEPL